MAYPNAPLSLPPEEQQTEWEQLRIEPGSVIAPVKRIPRPAAKGRRGSGAGQRGKEGRGRGGGGGGKVNAVVFVHLVQSTSAFVGRQEGQRLLCVYVGVGEREREDQRARSISWLSLLAFRLALVLAPGRRPRALHSRKERERERETDRQTEQNSSERVFGDLLNCISWKKERKKGQKKTRQSFLFVLLLDTSIHAYCLAPTHASVNSDRVLGLSI